MIWPKCCLQRVQLDLDLIEITVPCGSRSKPKKVLQMVVYKGSLLQAGRCRAIFAPKLLRRYVGFGKRGL